MKMHLSRTVVTVAVAAVTLPALSPASRLTPLVGSWTCRDTGSTKPYAASVTDEGRWILWRDTGEDANTIYIRWNPSMQRYVVANIDGEGDVEVSTTSDTDPLNATWHVRFPDVPSSPMFTVKYSSGTFSLARPYVDRKGKPGVERLACRKR